MDETMSEFADPASATGTITSDSQTDFSDPATATDAMTSNSQSDLSGLVAATGTFTSDSQSGSTDLAAATNAIASDFQSDFPDAYTNTLDPQSDFPDFATATNAITLNPQQTLAAQDAARLAAKLANDFKKPGMPSINPDAFVTPTNITALGYRPNGCRRDEVMPILLATNDTCLPGFHCPHSDDIHPPQYCPPTWECTGYRALQKTCNPPQGWYEPKICDNGYYCPNGKDQIRCPAGKFCPSGTQFPFNCSSGSLCPEGSQVQVVLAPVWVTLVLDAVLGVLVAIGFGISKWRKSRRKSNSTLNTQDPNQPRTCENVGLLKKTQGDKSNSPPVSPTASMDASPASKGMATLQLPHDALRRRSIGRVDNMDGYVDDDQVSTFDDDAVDSQNNPDFQQFIRSVSRSVTTQSIGLSFDFENLAFETNKGKKILQEVTGTMPRGSMWGIMGGSGAGKSTFLNVLMGKASHTGGTVKINGWTKDMSKYKKLIGYVPQDDIVFPELTVRENILHSARIRLPSSWRDKEIQDHVDSLLACLKLTHVQHSRVGDAVKPVISGGQRKRVNIGIELAAAPMAIFLDEPTSGLDATSASAIMRLLKAVSKLGVTVIAIVHQPREKIFYEFDQLLLLTSGRSVYSGATEGVQHYFESMGFAFPHQANPADTLMDIITGDGAQYATSSREHDTDVQYLIDEWKNTGQFVAHRKPTSHLSIPSIDGPYKSGAPRSRRISNQSINSTVEQEEELHRTMKARGATWPAQTYYCWKRAMTQQIRNVTSFFFEIVVGCLAGLLIGLSCYSSSGHLFQGLYHDPFIFLSSAVDYSSVPQLGLLGSMAIGLAASAPGFWVFGEEKLFYWRETASGHSRSAYYIGKLLSTIPRIALSSLHFSIFFSVLATPLMSFTEMYAANLMYFWCIYGLASCVSMIVKRENGPLLAVLASLIIGVLSGVAPTLRQVKTWHMEWFWRLSPGVWYAEAYFSQNLLPLEYLYQINQAARAVGYSLGQYRMDIVALVAIGAVYRIIAYLGLILIDRKRQR